MILIFNSYYDKRTNVQNDVSLIEDGDFLFVCRRKNFVLEENIMFVKDDEANACRAFEKLERKYIPNQEF